jgi:hypothetical protein
MLPKRDVERGFNPNAASSYFGGRMGNPSHSFRNDGVDPTLQDRGGYSACQDAELLDFCPSSPFGSQGTTRLPCRLFEPVLGGGNQLH